MEQYFAKQLSTCCKLNFSNNFVKPHKLIITPKKSENNTKDIKNKSQKKSLKRISSDHALIQTKKMNKQISQPINKEASSRHHKEVDDYGNMFQTIDRNHNKLESLKELHFSAINSNPKLFMSLDKKEVSPSPIKKIPAEELRNFRFSDKPNFIQIERTQQPRVSVVVQKVNMTPSTNPMTTYHQQQFQSRPTPVYFTQKANNFNNQVEYTVSSEKAIRFSHNPNQSNQSTFIPRSPAKSPSQHPTPHYQPNRDYFDSQFDQKIDQTRNTLTNTPVINKQTKNYTESFKRMYGEVEIQDQIKHDLMKSLEFVKVDSQVTEQYNNSNGLSIMLTKCPPSQESTILPPQSKLRKKQQQYQIDSFNLPMEGRKVCTQKYLKTSSAFMQKAESRVRLERREKFKSIVSVESEHSSTQSVDSIIIDHHPQKLISSNPIKSLL